MTLAEAIKDYKEYVLSDDPNPDRLSKYEHVILETAIEEHLGKEWWNTKSKAFD